MPKNITIQKLLGVLLRRLPFILMAGVLMAAIFFVYTSLAIKPVYSTSAMIYIQNFGKQQKTSDDPEGLIVKNAMYRSDLGPIDFRWGTPGRGSKFKGGYGLAHIIAKRNAENGRGVETVHSIVEAIAKAETSDRQYSDNLSNDHYRIRLYYGNTTVVLDKTPGSNHWLLTGWENNETATNAAGEVHDSADATAAAPTRTRRGGAAGVLFSL